MHVHVAGVGVAVCVLNALQDAAKVDVYSVVVVVVVFPADGSSVCCCSYSD